MANKNQQSEKQEEDNIYSEETNNKNHKEAKEHLRFSFKYFFTSVYRFTVSTLNIRTGADPEETAEGIKKDIDFKGPNVWILVSSIIIASIGLNINSIPVIVGAMLIAPLMGPILGIGLSVGTNDWGTLTRSLKNFAVMVIVSIITSFLFFYITPLKEVQSELLARTHPTFLDVAIAIFGGLAGIVAGSRKEKTNVIPGVAIATALMPPLCTAGFGLATGNFYYFIGAFYLFFLNSIFITLSTIVVVRYLKFPIVHYIDPVKEKKFRRYMILFLIIFTIPSAYVFYGVIKESTFQKKSGEFISQEIIYKNVEISNKVILFNDTMPVIKIFLEGDMIVPKNVIEEWQLKLTDYGLDETRLKIIQSGIDLAVYKKELETIESNVKNNILKDLYDKNQALIESKEEQIKFLEEELVKQKTKRSYNDIPFYSIEKELKIQYPRLSAFSYSMSIETNFRKTDLDTLCTFMVRWHEDVNTKDKLKNQQKMSDWLEVRLSKDSVRVLGY